MKGSLIKLAVLSLGVTTLGGVTLAVASNAGEVAIKADAAETVAYTLNPVTGSNNNYASNCDVTIDGVTWNVGGNASLVPWRIGGKSITNTSRLVYSKSAISADVSKVTLTVGAASSITVRSLTLKVSDSANGAAASSVVGTFAANSTITFTKPSGADWNNKYFAFDFNVTVSGSSNRFVEFKKAEFYADLSEDTKVLTSLQLSGQTTNYSVGDEFSFDGNCIAVYSNDDTEPVTPTEVSEPDMSTYGVKPITVTYEEGGVTRTAQYNIYVFGETTNPFVITGDDFVATYVANDGDHIIGGTCFVANSVTKNNGIQFQKDNGYIYNVTAMPEDISSIALANASNLKIYVGTSANDCTVEVSNGSAIVSGYRYFKIFQSGSTVGAASGITVRFGEVAKTPTSISLEGQTTEYLIGDAFAFTGTCTVNYSDGTSEEVTPTSVSKPDMTTVGEKTITVEYGEVSTTYTITVKSGEVNVAEALEIAGELEVGKTTTSKYSVTGYIKEVTTAFDAGYKNITFTIADTVDGTDVLTCFRVTTTAEASEKLVAGAQVKVTGKLTNYQGTLEIAQGGTVELLKEATTPDTPDTPDPTDGVIANGKYFISTSATSGEGKMLAATTTAVTSAPPAATTYLNSDESKAWTFTKVEHATYTDVYTISCGDMNLYTTDANNGMRINSGHEDFVWRIVDNGEYYTLFAAGINNARKMSLYNNADWRTYTGTNGVQTIYLTPVQESANTAETFATTFLSTVTCSGNGTITATGTYWNDMKTLFNSLAESEKSTLRDAKANQGGTTVQQAVARYDAIVAKYGTSSYEDFMERNVAPAAPVIRSMVEDYTTVTTVVTVSAIASVTLVGGLALTKKKKEF